MIKKLVKWYLQKMLNQLKQDEERMTALLGDEEYEGLTGILVNVMHNRESVQRVLRIIE